MFRTRSYCQRGVGFAIGSTRTAPAWRFIAGSRTRRRCGKTVDANPGALLGPATSSPDGRMAELG